MTATCAGTVLDVTQFPLFRRGLTSQVSTENQKAQPGIVLKEKRSALEEDLTRRAAPESWSTE